MLDAQCAAKVVVVDNSPTAEDADYIRSAYPDVHIIRTGENLGFAKANNVGLRYALDNGADTEEARKNLDENEYDYYAAILEEAGCL